jgi:hypothetical protein
LAAMPRRHDALAGKSEIGNCDAEVLREQLAM